MARFKCKKCGGVCDIIHEPEGRTKKCRNCYHTEPMKSRTSMKRRKLEDTLKSLKEGAGASHLSKHIVKCTSCEGRKKEPPCKRCNGTGKLEGNVKLPLDKQNTGVDSRIAWVKNVRENFLHTPIEDQLAKLRKKQKPKVHISKKLKKAFKVLTKEENEPKKYAIFTPAKTNTGWKRVKDTRFDTEESAHRYGMKYHTDKSGAKMFKVGELKEEIAANCMGASSSIAGTGAIDTFDPILKINRKRKERIKDMFRRSLLTEKP